MIESNEVKKEHYLIRQHNIQISDKIILISVARLLQLRYWESIDNLIFKLSDKIDMY